MFGCVQVWFECFCMSRRAVIRRLVIKQLNRCRYLWTGYVACLLDWLSEWASEWVNELVGGRTEDPSTLYKTVLGDISSHSQTNKFHSQEVRHLPLYRSVFKVPYRWWERKIPVIPQKYHFYIHLNWNDTSSACEFHITSLMGFRSGHVQPIPCP